MAVVMKASKRDAYVGERNKQVREGYGVYSYENKFFKYEGEWKAGKKHGHGKLIMADSSYYEGEFQNGEIEGHGFRYYSSSGNTYSGEFSQGELQGQGIMKYKNGSVYEGTWAKNKRSGYGVFKNDNSIYQGYSHNNKRHGEGTQIFSNGDRYDGDWVNDMRQGHGQFRTSDGTQYNGQFRNDSFNGQGTMEHCSGMLYEGLWINGHPANMASKLVITNASPVDVTQGVYFEIEVQCQNDLGTATHDQGRQLRISAGYQNILPEKIGSKSAKKSASGGMKSALFDMIEDVEEKVVETPFGYSVIMFPLTDQMPDRETLGPPPDPKPISSSLSRQPTSLTAENTMVESDSKPAEGEEKKEEKKEEPAENTEGKEGEARPEGVTTEGTQLSQEPSSLAEPPPEPEPEVEETPVYPPPDTQRTQQGAVTFGNLILGGAPPMYRPFVVQDEQEKMEKNKQFAKAGKKAPKVSATDVAASQSITEMKEEAKTKAKKFGDERYARPGEYVVMVEDVTDPPFMGITLQPAFIQAKVSLPKKVKKEKPKKEKAPRWESTSSFIAGEMAREYSNIAARDVKKMQKAKKYAAQDPEDTSSEEESEHKDNVADLEAIKFEDADPGGPLRKSTSQISIKSSYSEN